MQTNPQRMPLRSVGEWSVQSDTPYRNPFADVLVDAEFQSPSGKTFLVPAFYDGDGMWRVRFNPNEVGVWHYRFAARPKDATLAQEGDFEVTPRQGRGFLCTTPGRAWGFHYESGEPVFIFGDTTYNLFGMAHCGLDVRSFMARRVQQGFNLLRVRVPVSPFHPPEGYNEWQTRRTWPWGGSEQRPQLERFNLEYFRTVDAVVREAEALGLGLEMIMEAWGFESPFNRRDLFVPEWEELWLRYLVARYDAFGCVFFWTLMNEYEYYPDGDWRYNPVADRWAMRVGRWLRGIAPHGHIISVHNGPRMPPFAERFRLDPTAIDVIMFQDWGTRDRTSGWLAAGIEEAIQRALEDWPGSAVFAEWGYERNPTFQLRVPGHEFCDQEHTRRGAWRGAFCGLGIIHGFENSWGPWAKLDEDQPGIVYLLHVRRFFTEMVPFAELKPAPHLIQNIADCAMGERPLALATEAGSIVAVYLPTGGRVDLALRQEPNAYSAHWYDPCTGELLQAAGEGSRFCAPQRMHNGHPQDWVLLLKSD